MDNMIEMKNGVMALSINRKGSPLINGLFFEWITGKVLKQKHPVILFTPEFFNVNKAIPKDIIANTSPTCGANAYLNEKINGVGFINPSRFSIQSSGDEILITIPGKKNILEVVFFIPMALLWGYFAGYAIYLFVLINYIAFIAQSQGPLESNVYSTLAIIDGFALLFIAFILLWIWIVISSTIRHMAGKELIGVDSRALSITRQTFMWKKRHEFSSEEVMNLRVDDAIPTLFRAARRAFRSALGRNGIIVFEYQGKTIRFGVDISEDEGKHMLTTIKTRMGG